MVDEAKAARAVKFFSALKHTKGKFYGKPFIPLPWQERIIRDVYGTVRDDGTRQYRFVYLEVPKKNGKSELVAGTALFHLLPTASATARSTGARPTAARPRSYLMWRSI